MIMEYRRSDIGIRPGMRGNGGIGIAGRQVNQNTTRKI
jgi:hypothetical protein